METGTMKRTLLWFIVAAALLASGFLALPLSRPGDNLNVDPHTRKVIEKAKQR